MDLFNAKSIEELKKYGKLNQIKGKLNNLLGRRIRVSAKGWKDLLVAIRDLDRFIKEVSDNSSDYTTSVIRGNINEDVEYFKSEVDKLIFYILELDGEIRLDKLGITSFHYRNSNYAKKWWKSLSRKLHPDVCKHPKAEEAIKELNKIYERMENNERQRTVDSSS